MSPENFLRVQFKLMCCIDVELAIWSARRRCGSSKNGRRTLFLLDDTRSSALAIKVPEI